MREIKFRAWDGINKKMIYGPTPDNPSSSWVLALPDEIIKMQYTGLKDEEEIVLEAVKQNGLSFAYASQRIKHDNEIALEAVKQVLEAVKQEFKYNYEMDFCLELLKTIKKV